MADEQQAAGDGDGWVLKKDGWFSQSAAEHSDCSWDVYDGNIYQVEGDWLAESNENKHV